MISNLQHLTQGIQVSVNPFGLLLQLIHRLLIWRSHYIICKTFSVFPNLWHTVWLTVLESMSEILPK
jgi:hypothetical protein